MSSNDPTSAAIRHHLRILSTRRLTLPPPESWGVPVPGPRPPPFARPGPFGPFGPVGPADGERPDAGLGLRVTAGPSALRLALTGHSRDLRRDTSGYVGVGRAGPCVGDRHRRSPGLAHPGRG